MPDAPLTVKRFRWLLVFFALSMLILWTLPLLVIVPSEEAYSAFLTYDGFDAVMNPDDTLYWGLLVLWLVATVALDQRWRSSREMFLGLTVLSIVIGYLSGTRVWFALDGTIGYLSALANGAIVAMAYGSEVSKNFDSGPKRLRASAQQGAVADVSRS